MTHDNFFFWLLAHVLPERLYLNLPWLSNRGGRQSKTCEIWQYPIKNNVCADTWRKLLACDKPVCIRIVDIPEDKE
jgi:hypothetical protein